MIRVEPQTGNVEERSTAVENKWVVDSGLPNGSNDAEIRIDRAAAEELDYV